jgi:hypothetical protein
VGNAAVARLFAAGAQPKLQVGPAADRFEQEADRVADEVMRLRPAPSATEPTSDVGPDGGGDFHIHRAPMPGGDAPVGLDGGDVEPGVEQEIRSARGGGAGLPAGIRHSMEGALGADFGGVRVHTGRSADSLNRAMQSRAFTLGSDVFFAKGQYQPATTGGQRLLAHELTHTIQQGGSAHRDVATIQRWNLRDPGEIPWGSTTSIRTVTRLRPVLFFDDNGGDTIVVKAEEETLGLQELAGFLHEKVSGATSVYTREVTAAKNKILHHVNDPGKTTDASWAALGADPGVTAQHLNGTPADNAKQAQLALWQDYPKVIAMEMAAGTLAEAVIQPGGAALKAMTEDKKYLYQAGLLTASDLFTGNEDRMVSGNFGNFFLGVKNSPTLIDNVNPTAVKAMRQVRDEPLAEDPIRGLAHGQLKPTAAEVAEYLWKFLQLAGNLSYDQYKAQEKAKIDFMEAHILRGLRDGRKRLIKQVGGPLKKRSTKAAASRADDADTMFARKVEYFDVLTARARWLEEN